MYTLHTKCIIHQKTDVYLLCLLEKSSTWNELTIRRTPYFILLCACMCVCCVYITHIFRKSILCRYLYMKCYAYCYFIRKHPWWTALNIKSSKLLSISFLYFFLLTSGYFLQKKNIFMKYLFLNQWKFKWRYSPLLFLISLKNINLFTFKSFHN